MTEMKDWNDGRDAEIARLRARNAELGSECDEFVSALTMITNECEVFEPRISVIRDNALRALAGTAPPPQPSAVPELLDETSARAKCLHVSDEIHNLACEYQDDEALCERLADFANRLWRLALSLSTAPEPQQPTGDGRDALVAALQGFVGNSSAQANFPHECEVAESAFAAQRGGG